MRNHSSQTGRPNPVLGQTYDVARIHKGSTISQKPQLMLIDHLIVDRAYGGRFHGEERLAVYIPDKGKAWDVLTDKYPDTLSTRHSYLRSAAAANPVCLHCKSQDNILDWAYMGDPDKGAKWSRTSNVVEVAKSIQHGLNCFQCHDPHAAKTKNC